jgi:hypothetical protein
VDGHFSFNAEFGKKYSITLSYVGYKEKQLMIFLSQCQRRRIVNIVSWKKAAKALEGVTVKSSSRSGAQALKRSMHLSHTRKIHPPLHRLFQAKRSGDRQIKIPVKF